MRYLSEVMGHHEPSEQLQSTMGLIVLVNRTLQGCFDDVSGESCVTHETNIVHTCSDGSGDCEGHYFHTHQAIE